MGTQRGGGEGGDRRRGQPTSSHVTFQVLRPLENTQAMRTGAAAGAAIGSATLTSDGLGLLGPRVGAIHLHLPMGTHSKRGFIGDWRL